MLPSFGFHLSRFYISLLIVQELPYRFCITSNPTALQEIFWSLFDPRRFMATTLPFLSSTLRHLYSIGEFSILFSWQNLQYAWFSAFWLWFGPQLRANNGDRITALLEGRIASAQVTKSPVAPPVSGVVPDIGPGRGYWIDLYAKADITVDIPGARFKSGRDGIKKVYCVEPNTDSHAALSKRVEEIGLAVVYEVLPVGIEELGKVRINGTDKSIKKGSVDCIVSILCLCSISEPETNIAELYGLLKKGGRSYLYEHVRTKDGLFMRLYQEFFNLFWPVSLGGCELCRDTESYLRKAGPWEKVDLAQPPDEPWHQTVPHILGIFTK